MSENLYMEWEIYLDSLEFGSYRSVYFPYVEPEFPPDNRVWKLRRDWPFFIWDNNYFYVLLFDRITDLNLYLTWSSFPLNNFMAGRRRFIVLMFEIPAMQYDMYKDLFFHDLKFYEPRHLDQFCYSHDKYNHFRHRSQEFNWVHSTNSIGFDINYSPFTAFVQYTYPYLMFHEWFNTMGENFFIYDGWKYGNFYEHEPYKSIFSLDKPFSYRATNRAFGIKSEEFGAWYHKFLETQSWEYKFRYWK